MSDKINQACAADDLSQIPKESHWKCLTEAFGIVVSSNFGGKAEAVTSCLKASSSRVNPDDGMCEAYAHV